MAESLPLTCVVCGANNWIPDPEAGRISRVRSGYHIVQCANCKLRRLDPMPTQDQLRTFYEDDSLKHEYISQNSSAYVAGASRAEAYITDRLNTLSKRLGKVGSILDIGAAQGAFLAQARDLGWTCSGIELSTEGVAEAQSLGLDVQQKTLPEAAFPDANFDVVHLSHVLEHLPDPAETLREIQRILKPGGLLAIEVPNEFDDLFGALRQRFLGRRRPEYAVPSPHVYFYLPSNLKTLVQNAGFEPFHLATPRRNVDFQSRYPLGGAVRRAVFNTEAKRLQGPNIEIYAVKRD